MNRDFWIERWESNRIGFHSPVANPMLVEHVDQLALTEGSRLFMPLCGKSLDIGWLLARGHEVAGVELSKLAVDQLFDELEVQPEISQQDAFLHYRADGLDIYVGDIFNLHARLLGTVDAIYDRAALVALPEQMRQRYTRHLVELSNAARQLLLAFEYDQTVMDGPPFSISGSEVRQHYASVYETQLIASEDVIGGLKGVCPAKEHVWLLA